MAAVSRTFFAQPMRKITSPSNNQDYEIHRCDASSVSATSCELGNAPHARSLNDKHFFSTSQALSAAQAAALSILKTHISVWL
ncbi:hypothetical protein [Pseudoxanthomonas indica]|uniref:hypothetical protein n=1 Tax=Pseudoxanthomonas indica TaxID=428993 RepID=UPI001665F215|nr:hypothetical protein [Pseudoxanthomonas indica]